MGRRFLLCVVTVGLTIAIAPRQVPPNSAVAAGWAEFSVAQRGPIATITAATFPTKPVIVPRLTPTNKSNITSP